MAVAVVAAAVVVIAGVATVTVQQLKGESDSFLLRELRT